MATSVHENGRKGPDTADRLLSLAVFVLSLLASILAGTNMNTEARRELWREYKTRDRDDPRPHNFAQIGIALVCIAVCPSLLSTGFLDYEDLSLTTSISSVGSIGRSHRNQYPHTLESKLAACQDTHFQHRRITCLHRCRSLVR